MDRTFWHKQTTDEPLFPDLLWSRPQNKRQAGKLLIIGGNEHGFATAAASYSAAMSAGIGTARVLLPDSLQKTVSRIFPAAEFAPSTPSGSFAVSALAELADGSDWSDGVLLAGNLGRNSETAILLEKFIKKYSGPLVLAEDAVDYFVKMPEDLLRRPNTLLVLSFEQLQKLGTNSKFTTAFTSSMDFLRLVEALHEFGSKNKAWVVVEHVGTVFVAVDGEVSTTKQPKVNNDNLIDNAAKAAVWLTQNPTKPFEAITSCLVQ